MLFDIAKMFSPMLKPFAYNTLEKPQNILDSSRQLGRFTRFRPD